MGENEEKRKKPVGLLGKISEKVNSVEQSLKEYKETLMDCAKSFEVSSKMGKKLINDFNRGIKKHLDDLIILSANEKNLKEMHYIVNKKPDKCESLLGGLSFSERKKFLQSLTYFLDENSQVSPSEEKSYLLSISDMYGILLPIIEEDKNEEKEKEEAKKKAQGK
jgi:hypothetical protein